MAMRAGWIGGGAAALVALSPGQAEAQAYLPFDPHVSAEIGFAWYDGPKFTVGASFKSGGDVGALARIEFLGLTAGRLTLGGYGSNLVGGELGFTGQMRWKEPRPFTAGLHGAAGVDLGAAGLWLRGMLPFAGEVDLWSAALALTLSPSKAKRVAEPIDGRPLRAGASFVQTPVVPLGEAIRELSPEEQTLKQEASDSAAAEATSIPSFLRLAAELEAAGAPDALAHRARAAAMEEVHHARLVLAQADRRAGASHVIPLLQAAPRSTAHRREALSRLAIESWLDGCLNEGIAAAQAAASARLATDPSVRRTQRLIARDEAGHAELAWDVLEWAMREGPPAVRDRVASEIELATPTVEKDDESLDLEWLQRQGRVSAKTKALVAAQQAERAQARLKRLLDRVA